MKKALDLFGTILIAFVLAMLLKTTVFALPEIRMSSMENTLLQGERALELKFVYSFLEPKRGDVIVFDKENKKAGFVSNYLKEVKETIDMIRGNASKNHLIKRVIGIPGDEIEFCEGNVYINDVLLEEGYIKGETFADEMETPFVVPEGKVFVMGDNREVSLDSRNLGFIDYKQIEGKVIARIWPLKKMKVIKGLDSNNLF
ncbi:MAG: signal peptidase I [Firmicutes bacterium]|nr:signal peptidase I [Bacillota bacterium]